MDIFDYVVVGFYLLFMFGLGPVYKSFSKNSSDFFRGGGAMLWWVVGSSAFMTSFSAWAFTGGAAKAYETGTFYLLVFACNIIALTFCYFFLVARYRRMRIITIMEGVRKRFGKTSEQVLTWLLVITRIIIGGVMLYTIAVFMASVFEVPDSIMNGIQRVLALISQNWADNFNEMSFIIIILGTIITLMTVFGGSWSATAGDFVQMLVVGVITITMCVMTLIKAGGLKAVIDATPSYHLDWTEFARPSVIAAFVVALLINQMIQLNSLMEGAARYIFAKDGPSAKKAILLQIAGFVALPLIWIIPPIMAVTWYPNLSKMYPTLNNAHEACYVALAVDLLPTGLFGLLVCGIFAATVTSCNSHLNVCGGNFVRNIYIQIIRPKASEKEQVLVGRITIFVIGVLWIFIGMGFQQLKGISLFDLVLMVAATVGLPMAVPLFLGIFFKKTPAWSGWTTMIAGFIPATILGFLFKSDKLVAWLWQNPEMTSKDLVMMMVHTTNLNDREIGDLIIAMTTLAVAGISCGWFFLTRFFYREDDHPYVDEVDEFFTDMATPIQGEMTEAETNETEYRQQKVLANLTLIYGAFILLLVFIPNKASGRICILICAAVVIGIGLLIKWGERRIFQKIQTSQSTETPEQA